MQRTSLFLSLLIFLYACENKTEALLKKSISHLQAEELDSAKACIDRYLSSENSQPEGLYYKGFIFKEIYNENKSADSIIANKAREIALNSFEKFLDSESTRLNELKETTIKSLKFLSSTIYNDAVQSLNNKQYEEASTLYKTHRHWASFTESAEDMHKEDINFNLVLGQNYLKKYEEDREKNHSAMVKSLSAFKAVIDLDSTNVSANYNCALLYYNDAVIRLLTYYDCDELMKKLDFSDPSASMPSIEEIMKCPLVIPENPLKDNELLALFNNALPYFINAYEQAPNKKEILMGLSGIYFALENEERVDFYNKQLEELNKQNKVS